MSDPANIPEIIVADPAKLAAFDADIKAHWDRRERDEPDGDYRPWEPVELNDIEATGHCCCAGCIGMGPCDLDPCRSDEDDPYDLPEDEDQPTVPASRTEPDSPSRHASPHCACGINDIGQRYVDPICERRLVEFWGRVVDRFFDAEDARAAHQDNAGEAS